MRVFILDASAFRVGAPAPDPAAAPPVLEVDPVGFVGGPVHLAEVLRKVGYQFTTASQLTAPPKTVWYWNLGYEGVVERVRSEAFPDPVSCALSAEAHLLTHVERLAIGAAGRSVLRIMTQWLDDARWNDNLPPRAAPVMTESPPCEPVADHPPGKTENRREALARHGVLITANLGNGGGYVLRGALDSLIENRDIIHGSLGAALDRAEEVVTKGWVGKHAAEKTRLEAAGFEFRFGWDRMMKRSGWAWAETDERTDDPAGSPAYDDLETCLRRAAEKNGDKATEDAQLPGEGWAGHNPYDFGGRMPCDGALIVQVAGSDRLASGPRKASEVFWGAGSDCETPVRFWREYPKAERRIFPPVPDEDWLPVEKYPSAWLNRHERLAVMIRDDEGNVARAFGADGTWWLDNPGVHVETDFAPTHFSFLPEPSRWACRTCFRPVGGLHLPDCPVVEPAFPLQEVRMGDTPPAEPARPDRPLDLETLKSFVGGLTSPIRRAGAWANPSDKARLGRMGPLDAFQAGKDAATDAIVNLIVTGSPGLSGKTAERVVLDEFAHAEAQDVARVSLDGEQRLVKKGPLHGSELKAAFGLAPNAALYERRPAGTREIRASEVVLIEGHQIFLTRWGHE